MRLDELVGIALLAVMTVAMGLSVASRYLGLGELFWLGEFVEYLYIWLIYVGAAIAFRRGGHVGFEGLLERLPASVQAVGRAAGRVLVAVFLTAVAVISVNVLQQTATTPSAVLRIPMAAIYAAIPLSALLMLTELVGEAWRHRRKGAGL